ncbi:glycosyl hydrolase family protein [Klebsormidium nitens]|uniref:glucan endo-1,3-beta-D-glucosidase n=1 Tax=Klebsormidium nitens TaxID=105231 RepID=A0A1Y1ID94_KLENI|nr:glycosyl hydrolase family protein [Klebsormidium nitens]|eukprot:GAQ86697.1 glycosyl hydrolase family protein [Klebsormidium nitens]
MAPTNRAFVLVALCVLSPTLTRVSNAATTNPFIIGGGSTTPSTSGGTTTTAPTTASTTSLSTNPTDPISTSKPNTLFTSVTHPVTPKNLDAALLKKPIPTNEFWTSLVFGSGTGNVYVNPYVVWPNTVAPFGLSISHADEPTVNMFTAKAASDRAMSYTTAKQADMGFSSAETGLGYTVTAFDEFSATLVYKASGGTSSLTFPLVKGMAYVTANYAGLTPVIYTAHSITGVAASTAVGDEGKKFTITLSNGDTWLLYSLSASLTLSNSGKELRASGPVTGTLRLAKIPNNKNTQFCFNEIYRKSNTSYVTSLYDSHRWRYPIGGQLNVTVLGTGLAGAYIYFKWNVAAEGAGATNSQTFKFANGTVANVTIPMLHFGFPHHQDTIVNATTSSFRLTNLAMMSPTKGMMQAFEGDRWILREGDTGTITWTPPNAMQTDKYDGVVAALIDDLALDFSATTGNQSSNYELGRQLQKYAMLCQAADVVGVSNKDCITKLTSAMANFVKNKQLTPLNYDATWGGLVSSSDIKGNTGNLTDNGNTYYNYHHYNYGPFIYAAAVLRYYSSTWGTTNGAFIEELIRDVANPSALDTYYPTFRSFDWFHGHNWGKGLVDTSANGRDVLSVAEEINFAHAVRLYGLASSKQNIQNLGMALFAVSRRTARRYFLINKAQNACPYKYRDNKVAGIATEGQVTYATYADNSTEAIHGQHMRPMILPMEIVRFPDFVLEEWTMRLQDYAPFVNNTWTSALYSNLAIINVTAAWSTLVNLQPYQMDPTTTKSWVLFWAATRPEPKLVNKPNIFGPWGNSTCYEPGPKAKMIDLLIVFGTCVVAGACLVFAFCVTQNPGRRSGYTKL